MIWILDVPLKKESVEEFVSKLNHCFNGRIMVRNDGSVLDLFIRSGSEVSENLRSGSEVSESSDTEDNQENDWEISVEGILNCDNFLALIPEESLKKSTNRFEELSGNEDTAFFMIKSNHSLVSNGLDVIRKHPKKFICLNDDLDHSARNEETFKVKRTIRSFYESLFPLPSQFEIVQNDEREKEENEREKENDEREKENDEDERKGGRSEEVGEHDQNREKEFQKEEGREGRREEREGEERRRNVPFASRSNQFISSSLVSSTFPSPSFVSFQHTPRLSLEMEGGEDVRMGEGKKPTEERKRGKEHGMSKEESSSIQSRSEFSSSLTSSKLYLRLGFLVILSIFAISFLLKVSAPFL